MGQKLNLSQFLVTVLLIYLTAPQLFSFMWTRACWNLGWVNVQKTFKKSVHFLLPSLWVTEIHGHLFSRVSGLYHYFLLYLSLPESLKYMATYSLRFWDFIVIFSCTWVTEKHGHLFSGVLGLYCHIHLYLSHWNTSSFVLWGFGTLSLFRLVSESPWVSEIHGHLFSGVSGFIVTSSCI